MTLLFLLEKWGKILENDNNTKVVFLVMHSVSILFNYDTLEIIVSELSFFSSVSVE